jgi:hypothetical protein
MNWLTMGESEATAALFVAGTITPMEVLVNIFLNNIIFRL